MHGNMNIKYLIVYWVVSLIYYNKQHGDFVKTVLKIMFESKMD
jgi:hypothetical protein